MKCQECGESIIRNNVLKHVSVRHLRLSMFSCRRCSYESNRTDNSNIRIHVSTSSSIERQFANRRQSKQKSIKAERNDEKVCRKGNASEGSGNKKNRKSKTIECSKCQKVILNRCDILYDHIAAIHQSNANYRCRHCTYESRRHSNT